jgi:hypothetical protein
MKLICAVAIIGLTISAMFTGCTPMSVMGEIARSGQKDVDVVFSPGITAATLKAKKSLGVSMNGVDKEGRYVFAIGTGGANANIYSDMITKEFLKLGYKSKHIDEQVSESMPKEKIQEIGKRGFDMLFVGSMNLSATSDRLGWATGGDFMNVGITSFTVKGLDVNNGDILFILSMEYGKAKNAGEVAKDMTQLYHDVVMGEVVPEAEQAKN